MAKKASPSEEGDGRCGKKEERKSEAQKMETWKDAGAAAVTQKTESKQSPKSSRRTTRKSTTLDAQKANGPPAEQPRSGQALPEEIQKQDYLTPTKSVITTPQKGMYQIGQVLIPTVKGHNVVQIKLANEAVEMKKAGVKPYTKKHFHRQFEREIENNLKTDEGKAKKRTYWEVSRNRQPG